MLEDLKNLHRSNNMGYGEKHSKKCTGVNMDSRVKGSACTITGVPTE